jgi:hypothetical protein
VVGGLIRAHDTLQFIRIRRLLQLINTSIIETLELRTCSCRRQHARGSS